MKPTDRSGTIDHEGYQPFLRAVRETFITRVAALDGAPLIFRTADADLWETYLGAFGDERQTYNCRACQTFVERFGGLVTINADGTRTSLLWDPSSMEVEFFDVIWELKRKVERRRVVGAFVSDLGMLGTPQTGVWSHLAVPLPGTHQFHDRLRTPEQRAAHLAHLVETVDIALTELSETTLNTALRIFEADALSRSEKFVGPVTWLLDLKRARGATHDERRREALLWRGVATAPEGYCHPRASVLGPLFTDIEAGKSFEELQPAFAAKLHPLRYQRPQAAPSAGNVAAAERIFERLGLAPALERRYARLDECETIWTNVREASHALGVGVFSDVRTKVETSGRRGGKTAAALDLPRTTMTWDKFARTVLPRASALDLNVPRVGNFIALVTATHRTAPPIIKWDRETDRNPVTWYVYHNGSAASAWGLRPDWTPVTAVVPLPCLWGATPTPHNGNGFVLVLKGAQDHNATQLCLFPSFLREELHDVRATIEAFSRERRITGAEDASACGYDIRAESLKGQKIHLRATIDGGAQEIVLDRFD